MMIRRSRFNIYLALILAVSVGAGCQTEEGRRKSRLSALGLFAEMTPDPLGHTQKVTVGKSHPVKFNISKEPFLTEAYVQQASVMEVMGGFVIRIQFDRSGTLTLEQATSMTRGKHILVYCQWTTPPEETLNEGRWLAAPKILGHITDGVFTFTPDATREEADQIVLGLNNVARKTQVQPVKM